MVSVVNQIGEGPSQSTVEQTLADSTSFFLFLIFLLNNTLFFMLGTRKIDIERRTYIVITYFV